MSDTNNIGGENEKMTIPASLNNGSTFGTDPVRHAHVGPILGVLVIMLVLVFIGLYVWGGILTNSTPVVEEVPIMNDEPETPRAEADQQILETLSPSDEVTAIEADLSSTNLDSLDAELSTIDAELNAEPEVQ